MAEQPIRSREALTAQFKFGEEFFFTSKVAWDNDSCRLFSNSGGCVHVVMMLGCRGACMRGGGGGDDGSARVCVCVCFFWGGSLPG